MTPFLLLLLFLPLDQTHGQTPPNPEENIEYQNHYEVLQVEKTASVSDIKKAYRKLAVQWHPDKHAKTEDKEQATKIFQAIGRAYEVLSNEKQRQTFDDDLYFGNTGPQHQYRDPRSRGNIWEQLRKERLRKQQARQNSAWGQFDNALTYIIPLFFVFGAFRVWMNSNPEGGSSGGNGTSGNGNGGGGTDGSGSGGSGGSGGNGRGNDTENKQNQSEQPKSCHYKDVLQMAPSLVQLSSSHFDLSSFLIVFVVNGESEEPIPWEKINNLATSRRNVRSLSFAWVDLTVSSVNDTLKSQLMNWYPDVTNHGGDWTMVACRPKKAKGASYIDTTNVDYEKLGLFLDGLTDGSTKMRKF